LAGVAEHPATAITVNNSIVTAGRKDCGIIMASPLYCSYAQTLSTR
jgi:hypothetical protein